VSIKPDEKPTENLQKRPGEKPREKPRTLRTAWRIAAPYWRSEDWKWAWGLTIVVVVANLATVYILVRLNTWRNDFYNALQQYDWTKFVHQIALFSLLAGLWIAISVYQLYLQQMLQIRWRRWLTRRYLDIWLDGQAYYRMQQRGSNTDNPDQRISDDLNRFTSQALSLSIGGNGLLNSVVTLLSFLAILWSLSGTLTLPLGSWGTWHIPGYMLWIALVYAVGGTWLTVKIGRPLVGLNFQQQRFEADFRFSMARLRENTEAVALYAGEARERGVFIDRFAHVVDNFWAIMRRVKRLGWFTFSYQQVAVIIPYVVAAPRYFSKSIELGGLMQVADAFGQVQSALSFIVNSYQDIAEWQSVIARLDSFETRAREIADAAQAPQPIVRSVGGNAEIGVEVDGLDLALPDGTPLLTGLSFSVPPAEAALIVGPDGVGKSTLLRAIAGIWPYGRGRIALASGAIFFLPQRPYLPLGTLRHALLYPQDAASVPAARIAAALAAVGLDALQGALDTGDNWGRSLSLGEQQRLAFARLLLAEPRLVFLDEATSALGEGVEAELYRLLRAAPWRPTIVSVGHRVSLRRFHDKVIDVAPFAARPVAMTSAAE
jgi:putative ATP-binding cassette transporter